MGILIRDRLEHDAASVIEAYQSGYSLDDLAQVYKCSATPIRHFLIRHAIPIRPAKRRRVLGSKVGEIRSLYQSGVSTAEIASQLGVNRDTVSLILRDEGIRRNVPLRKRSFEINGAANIGMLAGLLLGEGSIVQRKGGVSVRIVNTDKDIIEWLAQWGGKIYWTKPRNGCPKPCGVWDLSGSVNVFHCLSTLLPFLVGVKKQRAINGLSWLREHYGFSD